MGMRLGVSVRMPLGVLVIAGVLVVGVVFVVGFVRGWRGPVAARIASAGPRAAAVNGLRQAR
ncbi:MAG: hypothetical protein JWL67_2456 [Solirubrobacterales bacterium]|nr:hypothetical protein [Solirubrobacterales bacterium]